MLALRYLWNLSGPRKSVSPILKEEKSILPIRGAKR
jgi:hypothetical protein